MTQLQDNPDPPAGTATPDALVVGAGPAGLMAADALSAAGFRVLLAEAMPAPARKFLMAGKSGLNLTMDVPTEAYLQAFGPLPAPFRAILAGFGPPEAKAFAHGLGQELFTGSTGRVFPVAMKASPLLRAWLSRLDGRGVVLRRRWRWRGAEGGTDLFDTPEGPRRVAAGVTVLAAGGASWRRLGSDGGWTAALPPDALAPFHPVNVGLRLDWSPPMRARFGAPVKTIALRAGSETSRGEIAISSRGLEGGGLYPLGRALRAGAPLTLDLLPDLDLGTVQTRLAQRPRKLSLANHLRRALGLGAAKRALLNEFGRPFPDDLGPLLKALPVPHRGFRPLDEAISTGGGVRLDAVDGDLMLRHRPGCYAAGEMLDWEAPTGGYLITACLATGAHAGLAAARRLGAGPQVGAPTP